MIELIKERKSVSRDVVKEMSFMQPLEVCVVVDNQCSVKGELVMRTSSKSTFEVMSISNPFEDNCWSGTPAILVRDLEMGEEYTLRLFKK